LPDFVVQCFNLLILQFDELPQSRKCVRVHPGRFRRTGAATKRDQDNYEQAGAKARDGAFHAG
jgi:hypothetical protein